LKVSTTWSTVAEKSTETGAGAREHVHAAERLHAALATAVARALGGSFEEDAAPGNGWSRRLRLPLRGQSTENG
jgi:hypothetical protein